ncbi:MAG: hypothetical protein ABT02_20935 [Comamonadaceae bacterium SCN 68-20]|nr:MAG: hypothetical protein ABT02_20935 [Comamonadaceae bacterium SCN 68-20]
MKAATLRDYLSVHTWTGILAGTLLFIAFYAGGLSMFAPEITHWARAEPARVGASQDADALATAFFAAHPKVERATLVLASDTNAAPLMRWGKRGRRATSWTTCTARVGCPWRWTPRSP